MRAGRCVLAGWPRRLAYVTHAHPPASFVRLDSEAGLLRLLYRIHQPLALGYGKRERLLTEAVALRLRRATPLSIEKTTDELWAIFPASQLDDVRRVAADIDRKLRDLIREPLPSVAVQAILGVTKAEVRIWNKDGRLKSSGTTKFIAAKQIIQTRMYGPMTIRRLLDDPGIIADWRAEDADV